MEEIYNRLHEAASQNRRLTVKERLPLSRYVTAVALQTLPHPCCYHQLLPGLEKQKKPFQAVACVRPRDHGAARTLLRASGSQRQHSQHIRHTHSFTALI